MQRMEEMEESTNLDPGESKLSVESEKSRPKIDKCVTDKSGHSALSAAENGSDLVEIERLLHLEAKIFTEGGGYGCRKAMLVAAEDGKAEVVKRLLQANADFNAQDRYGLTWAIVKAAEGGHFGVVQILLKAEKSITSVEGYYSLDALEEAVQDGKHREIERLQASKKVIELAHEGKCLALKAAAERGDQGLVELLVNSGADVNTTAHRGQPPLTGASMAGDLALVEYLIDRGAKINTRPDTFRRTPLHAAAKIGHLDIIERLLQGGADVNSDLALREAAGGGYLAVVLRLLNSGANVEPAPQMYRVDDTPLQMAAAGGHVQVVQTLLDAGADVNARGYTATALQAAAHHGSIDVVKILLSAGAEVNAPANEWKYTALQAAAEFGRLNIVDILLDAGAETETGKVNYSHVSALERAAEGGHMNVVDRILKHMSTKHRHDTKDICVGALYKASETGHLEITKALLEAGTPVVESEDQNSSLLESAVRGGNTSVLQLLINAGADIEAKRHPGHSYTALQRAVKVSASQMVKILLEAGADVNAAEGQVWSPLHMASEKGDSAMVKLLLTSGANSKAMSYAGKTVLEVAAKSGNSEVFELITTAAATMPGQPSSTTLRISEVTRGNSLCSICSKISLEAFENVSGHNLFAWQPSLLSHQATARSGCPFCMFVWARLNIEVINIPQPSPIQLQSSHGDDSMLLSSTEPYPKDIEYPKRISANFQFSLEPFEGKRTTIPENTSSPKTFHQIRSWLSSCDLGHPRCNVYQADNFLPTRLLYVGNLRSQQGVRLVSSKDLSQNGTRYIALSHCWGRQDLGLAKTTIATLQSRYKSISTDDLPRTFREAAEVARQLDVAYIWIDSLCIVQDSRDDWAREASMMSQVYQNAYCTIAASDSDSGTKGLFRSHSTDVNDSVQFQLTSSDGATRQVIAMKSQQNWQEMYEAGPLQRRGWVFQERELSPRILHFTNAQVLWECNTLSASEGWPAENMPIPSNQIIPIQRILVQLAGTDQSDNFGLWYQAVEDYTTRELTKTEDILPALAGLARVLKDRLAGGQYFAGLWELDLRRSLGWASTYMPANPHRRHSSFVAPTWSWASIYGSVSFKSIRKEPVIHSNLSSPTNGAVHILDIQVELAGPDTYGQLKSAHMKMSAPLVAGVLGYYGTQSYPQQGFQLRDFSGEHVVGDLDLDVPADRGSLQVVSCAYLFSQESTPGKGVGLALVAVEGQEKTYKRVGQVRNLELKFFQADVVVKEFTVI